ncbi:MAG: ribonuclease H-like domain-containing protein [Proteobacteria bacterium]|nr:ribonuclease H-like domain-containing protein [Pseudomonadota bacterium]MBU1687933.1 ribonuclease H-like domain-containing protein [Pseudomonadota bacterium]
MLPHTFMHIQGIGPKTEARLWQDGLTTWDDLYKQSPKLYSPARARYIRTCLDESRINQDTPSAMSALLPTSQHWRLFPHFRERTVYLDIETTGLGEFADITTIALYDGTSIRWYINGDNLDDFPRDINDSKVIVTYNGKSFDIPVIERFFNMKLPQTQLDLRHILRQLGYSGGLKGCEQKLGLNRGELSGFDGSLAVILWHTYRRTGDQRALATLLAYNILDTVNLEILMVEAYNRNVAKTPFAESLTLPPPISPTLPFVADHDLLETIRRQHFRW